MSEDRIRELAKASYTHPEVKSDAVRDSLVNKVRGLLPFAKGDERRSDEECLDVVRYQDEANNAYRTDQNLFDLRRVKYDREVLGEMLREKVMPQSFLDYAAVELSKEALRVLGPSRSAVDYDEVAKHGWGMAKALYANRPKAEDL